MTQSTDIRILDELQAAYVDFGAGRYARVVERTEALGTAGGNVGEALGQAARGLNLEASGRAAEAVPCMERAMALDVALPELLTALARYFSRSGRDLLAHYAFLMRDLHAPGTMRGFASGRPGDEQARYAPWATRRSMAAPDPDLYGLLGPKAALAERHGPEGAAMVLASITAPGQRPRRAVSLPLRPLIDYAREHGRDYAEPVPATTVSAQWPQVFEEDARPAYEARSRTLFTAVLEDVVVTAKSNVLLTPDVALHDVQGDELARLPVDLRVDPLVSAFDGEAAIVSAPADRAELRRIPEAIWLGGVHSEAFGHWIIEFLPKIWALVADKGHPDVPVLIDQQMPRQHMEALRFFAAPVRPIVIQPGEQVLVDQLRIASQLIYMPVGPLPGVIARPGDAVIDAEGLARLMKPFQSRLTAMDHETEAPRVYLPRPEGRRRKLEGGREVQTLLEQRGYAPFRFEELDFAHQVRIVRGADRIVAPDGSALMMTLFGRPGLRLGLFSHPYLEEFEWYTQASAALGHDVTVLTGTVVREDPVYRTFSDYRIDLDTAGRFLDGLEGQVET